MHAHHGNADVKRCEERRYCLLLSVGFSNLRRFCFLWLCQHKPGTNNLAHCINNEINIHKAMSTTWSFRLGKDPESINPKPLKKNKKQKGANLSNWRREASFKP